MRPVFTQPYKGFLQSDRGNGIIAGPCHVLHAIIISLQLIVPAILGMDQPCCHLGTANNKAAVLAALDSNACRNKRSLEHHAPFHLLGPVPGRGVDYFMPQYRGKFGLVV
jgi:hypothetical protein